MSLSRSSGVMKLVENGEIFVNKPFDEVKSSIPSQVLSLSSEENLHTYIARPAYSPWAATTATPGPRSCPCTGR